MIKDIIDWFVFWFVEPKRKWYVTYKCPYGNLRMGGIFIWAHNEKQARGRVERLYEYCTVTSIKEVTP